jgi:hypothetical protein
MAISHNPYWDDFSGAVDKSFVVKQYKDKTVITAYPDMSNVVFNPAQVKTQNDFARAVAFAQSIIRDPVKKAAYKVKKGESVYTRAIKDFIKGLTENSSK